MKEKVDDGKCFVLVVSAADVMKSCLAVLVVLCVDNGSDAQVLKEVCYIITISSCGTVMEGRPAIIVR